MKRQHDVLIDAEACIGCGLCVSDCPERALVLEEGRARFAAESCLMCGHCVALCPRAAVSMTGFDEQPRELAGPSAVDPHRLEDALRARRSIRRFADEDVPAETVERIIEAGRLTPTARNAQDVSYVVLRGAGKDEAEARAVRLFRRALPLAKLVMPAARRTDVDDRFFFKGAPVVVAVVAKSPVDGALAASNMALMAESHGLGVLYSGFFALATRLSPALRRQLGLERGHTVVTALVMGRPAVRYRRTAPKEAASVRLVERPTSRL
ncbi:nitroreductase family protein [Eggerthella sinensis]|uniref:nitroreductase family protein n=1 Tax=Eggerthella sinensis TaxID=242230 RepID=UPI001D06BF7C|nr:nitroreductase family protein [Eggerthella sinensis]MCB7037744.1 nitroreductase family protein [Eggerthella sinensis]